MRLVKRKFVVVFLTAIIVLFGCGKENEDDNGANSDGGAGDSGADIEPGLATVAAVPENGPAPLMVDFTCTASGGAAPYAFLWDFGDGTSSSVRNSSHTYVTVGEYTATCTITDDNGDVFQGNVGISVEDPDLSMGPVIDDLRSENTMQGPDVPSDCAVVNQDVVQLTVVAHDQSESASDAGIEGDGGLPADALIYQWVFESKPAGSVAQLNNANGYNPTFTPDREGVYVVRVFVSDDQAGALSLVTATIAITAGVGSRLVAEGSATQNDGEAGEIQPWAIPAWVVNVCGARAGNVRVLWNALNAVLPVPLASEASTSSAEEEDLGFVQLVGVRNGCPELPGTAAVTGIPYYTDPPDWFPDMVSETWSWNLLTGPPRKLGVELERGVPVIDSSGDPGEMDFGVSWVDGCGNSVTGEETVSFQANITVGSSCAFSTGGLSWRGTTDTTTWPTILCDLAEDVTVSLSGVSGDWTWGGECNIYTLSTGTWYTDALYGPASNWLTGYHEIIGPYSGSSSLFFDGEELSAYGWADWYYLYRNISYMDINCSTFLQNPYPYRLEWRQAFNFGSGMGGYMMGSIHGPTATDFAVDDEEFNWWAEAPTPAYSGSVGGWDVWDGSSRWAPASVDFTEPMGRFACDYMGSGLYFYWMFYVDPDTELAENYWMIDDVELWGWCTTGVDSEFVAGPYFEASVYSYSDGVIDCETQRAHVVVVGYDENGNVTPGAQVVVNYSGPGTVTLAEIHFGLSVSSGAGTATIELGPQGTATLYFEGDTAGTINITVVAATGGVDDTASIELFAATADEADAVCDNNMDDDCDGLTDCDDQGCAAATACLADLAFYSYSISHSTTSDYLYWSYRVQNIGNNISGQHDVALYIMDQGVAPTGTPHWTYSVDYASGALQPALAVGGIYPDLFTSAVSDSDYPFALGSLAPGDYTAYLVIDHTGLVAESDDTNNEYDYDFTVGPNLEENTLGTHTTYHDDTVDNEVDFTFYYRNSGYGISLVSTGCANITAYVMANVSDDPDTDTPITSASISDEICTLSAGGTDSTTISFADSFFSAGMSYYLWFRLDSGTELLEFDETDNLVGPVQHDHPSAP